ncbi:MAG TPA: glycosyltransferase, partial [Pseudonocardiaceae bacterium]|nr:glycosyltransferase [Pseudonocardiaceae bacterium]
FEKDDADRAALEAELHAADIDWLPLSYHLRPPVLSTLIDVAAGVRALRHATRAKPAAIVHVRSYVPALIALLARRWTGGKLIFDIRGFWADERIEGGIWPSGGWLYKLAKRCERWFFRETDAVVTLTHASVPKVREWLGGRPVPVVVIPTCADIALFTRTERRPGGPGATWVGSIGTWYRFDLAAPLARALKMPLNVVTRQSELARKILHGAEVPVKTLPLHEVPAELFSGDVGLCLYVASFSRVATAPTRLGEYLAAGMPVVVTPGVGDLERIVEEHEVGAVLRGESEEELARVASVVSALASDPAVQERCRSVARELFDVDEGAKRYSELYRKLLGSGPGSG